MSPWNYRCSNFPAKVGSSLCPIIIILHILLNKENNRFCSIIDKSKLLKGLMIFIAFYPICLQLDEDTKKIMQPFSTIDLLLSGSLWLRQPKVKVVFDDRTQTKASRALLSIRPIQEKHRKNFWRHLVGAMALKAGRPISQWKMTFWEKQCHEAIFWARKLIFSDFKPLTMIQIKTGTNFWFFDFKVSNHAHGVKTRILDY